LVLRGDARISDFAHGTLVDFRDRLSDHWDGRIPGRFSSGHTVPILWPTPCACRNTRVQFREPPTG